MPRTWGLVNNLLQQFTAFADQVFNFHDNMDSSHTSQPPNGTPAFVVTVSYVHMLTCKYVCMVKLSVWSLLEVQDVKVVELFFCSMWLTVLIYAQILDSAFCTQHF